MKHDNNLKILQNLGLNEKESKVYLATLSLGKTTIQMIAKAAEIKRTTAYNVVDSLQQKGLITVEIDGFKKKFVAENPERLEKMIDDSRNDLHKSLPELQSLYNLGGEESVIKYYEGREALKSVYLDNIRDIKPHQEYMVISNAEKLFNIYGDWFEKFVSDRGKLNINIRMILESNQWSREYSKFEKNYNHKIRFLPKETRLTTILVITPQRALIHQLNQPIMGIVIENRSAIEMHQQLFEVLWKTCK